MKPKPISPDEPTRRVLVAVELVDPITQALVSQGVTVRAAGLSGRPIVSYSGRFVWLEERDAWPTAISVDPERRPYCRQLAAPPPRPADLKTAKAGERGLRIVLRPAITYPFEDGVTVVRGRLLESRQLGSPPVEGARVQLAWQDQEGTWVPDPPGPDHVAAAGPRPSPREQETDEKGEFVVFLRLPANVQTDFLDKTDLLLVRLQVTRVRATRETRVTGPDFQFLSDDEDPENTKPSRVHEGRLLARELTLGWNALTPI